MIHHFFYSGKKKSVSGKNCNREELRLRCCKLRIDRMEKTCYNVYTKYRLLICRNRSWIYDGKGP